MGGKGKGAAVGSDGLVDESTNSLGFVSVLLLISVGLLAIVAADDAATLPVLAVLIVQILSCLFSCVFYAVAVGEVRLQRRDAALRAILLGNSLSEYLGVMNLLLAIPLTIATLVADANVSYMTGAICLAFLVGYHLSGLDLLSRTIPVVTVRLGSLTVVAVATAAALIGVAEGRPLPAGVGVSAALLTLSGLGVAHIIKEESRS